MDVEAFERRFKDKLKVKDYEHALSLYIFFGESLSRLVVGLLLIASDADRIEQALDFLEIESARIEKVRSNHPSKLSLQEVEQLFKRFYREYGLNA